MPVLFVGDSMIRFLTNDSENVVLVGGAKLQESFQNLISLLQYEGICCYFPLRHK